MSIQKEEREIGLLNNLKMVIFERWLQPQFLKEE